MQQYLIFDFDGVIGDTWDVLHDAKCVMMPEHTREQHIAMSNGYFSKKPSHTRNHSKSESEMKDLYDWTATLGHHINERGVSLFDDFVSEIRSLSAATIAIVSSGSQVYVMPAVVESGLEFTHVLAYENHHSKEEKIEIICTDWGVDPSDVYYFTDTLADVYELREQISENKLIGCAWGYCGYELLATELKPEYILKQATDIHRVV